MALADPHIGVHHLLVQAVAVAELLGLGHDVAQGSGVQELLAATLEDHGLEAVAGVDVADDLGDVLELALDEGELFAVVGGIPDGGGHDHALVEGGGGLRQGHGVLLVQGTMIVDALVVEGVAQLMGQGDDVAEETVEICQDAALAQALHCGAEGTAGLAGAGVEVDPRLVEGPGDHVRQLRVEAAEELHQVVPGLLGGVLAGHGAHGGKEVVPGQTVLVAQSLALGLQVLPELGQILVHGTQHGVQSFPAHEGLLQGLVQGTLVAAQLAGVQGLQLDGVQGVGHGIGNAAVAGQLGLVGILADGGIGIVGQIADGGEVGLGVPVVHLHGGGQELLQLRPGVAAGEAHLGHDLLAHAGEQVAAGLADIFKEEGVGGQDLILCHQLHQVGQLACPLLECSLGTGHGAEGTHDLTDAGTGLGILGVGGLAQHGVLHQLAAGGVELLLLGDAGLQGLQGVGGCQILGPFCKIRNGSLQFIQIPVEGRIVKAPVNGVQIPNVVHSFSPLAW